MQAISPAQLPISKLKLIFFSDLTTASQDDARIIQDCICRLSIQHIGFGRFALETLQIASEGLAAANLGGNFSASDLTMPDKAKLGFVNGLAEIKDVSLSTMDSPQTINQFVKVLGQRLERRGKTDEVELGSNESDVEGMPLEAKHGHVVVNDLRKCQLLVLALYAATCNMECDAALVEFAKDNNTLRKRMLHVMAGEDSHEPFKPSNDLLGVIDSEPRCLEEVTILGSGALDAMSCDKAKFLANLIASDASWVRCLHLSFIREVTWIAIINCSTP